LGPCIRDDAALMSKFARASSTRLQTAHFRLWHQTDMPRSRRMSVVEGCGANLLVLDEPTLSRD
jgi:hypothetical protein